MKIRSMLLLGILVLACCGKTNKDSLHEDRQSTAKENVKTLDNTEVPETILTLSTQQKTDSVQENINDNLFGKFFCDRAEFYIIQNPQNEIYATRPESITLYYLDNELRQTKYILTGDIVTQLVNELGNFKIVGLDFKNRNLINSKSIVFKTEKGVTLNDQLDNFELRWTFGNREVKYSVRAGARAQYVYIEKDKDFEKEFRAIEKYCI